MGVGGAKASSCMGGGTPEPRLPGVQRKEGCWMLKTQQSSSQTKPLPCSQPPPATPPPSSSSLPEPTLRIPSLMLLLLCTFQVAPQRLRRRLLSPYAHPFPFALASQSPPPHPPLAAKTLLPSPASNLSSSLLVSPSSPRGLSPTLLSTSVLIAQPPSPRHPGSPLHSALNFTFPPIKSFLLPKLLTLLPSDYPTSCHPPNPYGGYFSHFPPINLLQRQELLG